MVSAPKANILMRTSFDTIMAWDASDRRRVLAMLSKNIVESTSLVVARRVLIAIALSFPGLLDSSFRLSVLRTVLRVLQDSRTPDLEGAALDCLERLASSCKAISDQELLIKSVCHKLKTDGICTINIARVVRLLTQVGAAVRSAIAKAQAVEGIASLVQDMFMADSLDEAAGILAIDGVLVVAATSSGAVVQQTMTISLAEIWTRHTSPALKKRILVALRVNVSEVNASTSAEIVNSVASSMLHGHSSVYIARVVEWLVLYMLPLARDRHVRRAVMDISSNIAVTTHVVAAIEAMYALLVTADDFDHHVQDSVRALATHVLSRCSGKGAKVACERLLGLVAESPPAGVAEELVRWLAGAYSEGAQHAQRTVVRTLSAMAARKALDIGTETRLLRTLHHVLFASTCRIVSRVAMKGLVSVALCGAHAVAKLQAVEVVGAAAVRPGARCARLAIHSLERLAAQKDSAEVQRSAVRHLARAATRLEALLARAALAGILSACRRGDADVWEHVLALAHGREGPRIKEELAEALQELMHRKEEALQIGNAHPAAMRLSPAA